MDDEKELWINYKRTGSLEIREKLTLQYIPLVKYIVNKVIKTLPKNIEYEDMVEYGIIGLLDAVEKFDITKDINFKTYAVLRIRGAIYDELRVMDMLPRTLRTLSKNIENAYIEIEKKNGRAATDEEVAAYLNIEIKELDEIHSKINVANVSSLNDILHNSEDGKMTVGDIVEDKKNENPQESLEKKEIRKELLKHLKELSEKEKAIIALYYYDELTLKEIGKVMDVSESRVSQIHSKAVLKLRAKMAKKFTNYREIL
jgi:RNA polymerase sigma factor FliA